MPKAKSSKVRTENWPLDFNSEVIGDPKRSFDGEMGAKTWLE